MHCHSDRAVRLAARDMASQRPRAGICLVRNVSTSGIVHFPVTWPGSPCWRYGHAAEERTQSILISTS